MSDLNVLQNCGVCYGTGTVIPDYAPGSSDIPNPVTCTTCSGAGVITIGWVSLPTNIFWSYIILEELDTTEYAALTDTQKDGVLYLLACGKVDLNDGKAGKVRLWNWFGAESTTVANLTVLLE